MKKYVIEVSLAPQEFTINANSKEEAVKLAKEQFSKKNNGASVYESNVVSEEEITEPVITVTLQSLDKFTNQLRDELDETTSDVDDLKDSVKDLEYRVDDIESEARDAKDNADEAKDIAEGVKESVDDLEDDLRKLTSNKIIKFILKLSK